MEVKVVWWFRWYGGLGGVVVKVIWWFRWFRRCGGLDGVMV